MDKFLEKIGKVLVIACALALTIIIIKNFHLLQTDGYRY